MTKRKWGRMEHIAEMGEEPRQHGGHRNAQRGPIRVGAAQCQDVVAKKPFPRPAEVELAGYRQPQLPRATVAPASISAATA